MKNDSNAIFVPTNSNYTRAEIAADLNTWVEHDGAPLATNDERLTDTICQTYVNDKAELGQTLGQDEYDDFIASIWALMV